MKTRIAPVAFLALASLALHSGCGRESRAGETSPLAEVEKAYDEARPTIDRDIEELKTRAGSASEAARAEIEKALTDLDARRKALGEKLEELKTRTPDQARAMLDELKSEIESLKASASDAAKR